MAQAQVLDAQPDELQAVVTDVLAGVAAEFASVDYTEPLTEFLTTLEDAHLEYYQGEHDPLGAAWAPLSPRTIRKKGSDAILFEHGDMIHSLIASSDSNAIRGVIREGDQYGLVFGTSDEKAMFHMTGTARMPARPHVGLNDKLLDTLTNSLADKAIEGFAKG